MNGGGTLVGDHSGDQERFNQPKMQKLMRSEKLTQLSGLKRYADIDTHAPGAAAAKQRARLRDANR